MDASTVTDAAIAAVLVVVGVIGWLLSKKDENQEEKINKNSGLIEDLYNKHNRDVEKLNDLHLVVARDYYEKKEIDALFTMMRKALEDGFNKLETAIHELRNGKR